MGKPDVNRGNLLVVRLLQLRRHFGHCRQCRSAIKSIRYDALCDLAKGDLIFVAEEWEANIPARLAVRRAGGELQFLCPDPNAHGAAYAATAEPVTVTGLQQGLF
jgi:hypothetical protein